MKETALFIPVLLGANRQGRKSEHVARFLLRELEKHNLTTQLIDPRDFKFPHDDYGPNIKDQFPEYKKTIAKAHGLIIVTPEYNWGIPGILKAIIDLLYEEYAGKTVAIAACSNGNFGGIRAIANLIPTLRTCKFIISPRDLIFPRVQEIFDEEGNLRDKTYVKKTDEFLDTFINLTQKIHPWK